MSIDNNAPDPTTNTDESWLSRPEDYELDHVFAFGLYFLDIPKGESFDGSVSVGVSRPMPPDGPQNHSARVVLGYNGDSNVRLSNVLLEPDEARRLAKLLEEAAEKVGDR
ncbi:hypothetical protein ACQ86B_17345 [Mycolicibacterium aichiense]|uniref:hypothetical protein n=1 Tax=Mycolicibacterium aichiense TaxID=1799 RepID=UPI003D6741AD